ncbi:mitotic-spindle organizing protein 1 [Aspergillus nidulans FGSC A4]|uniref:mitotic-spindle organizing protein 1 n=1 Tax=Emericella nidulans (strain FGSC A4 / ATCC 38163 / CBS 112.46 / NRRL 194 / M139) TaxID=227321 RepID=UPI0001B78781|nr:hypothetical protein [Aspergillus nidulans FGSC A4]CBF87647.1 TPA: conserved hypothetical protein [Aspergillus nidulans FGSC A4]
MLSLLHILIASLVSQNTNLDRTELSLCVSLIENGVNPDALATVIKDLRTEAGLALRASNESPE